MLPWEKRQTYPPLYGPGFVKITIDEIDSTFITKVDTPARKRMASNLRNFLMYLKKLGVRGEAWIDGSFSTMNPNPQDFDMLLVIPRMTLAGMDPENLEELHTLTAIDNREYVRRKWSCDLYICEKSNITMQRQFETTFSNNPDKRAKGIPVITL